MNAFMRSVINDSDCPRCHRTAGHWCRDEKGKCVSPHSERSRAALGLVLAPYSYFIQRPDTQANSVKGVTELPERVARGVNLAPITLAAAAGKDGGR